MEIETGSAPPSKESAKGTRYDPAEWGKGAVQNVGGRGVCCRPVAVGYKKGRSASLGGSEIIRASSSLNLKTSKRMGILKIKIG